ncbi:MAG TPA: hypothetical protein VE713_13640 [Pyrinomonadaceae bacterium]|jgi:hypothetical protein|nr:hypothetical protein [Pyrinomonadaceae bacterium]
MQNYNNPVQPPGGYGAQPPKKGMSAGAKVLIVVAVLCVVGILLLIVVGVGGYLWYRHSAGEAVSASGTGGGSGLTGSPSSGSNAGDDAQPPQPTAEQSAAIAGGQSATWAQQEISWTVPQRWKQDSANSTSFNWSSPGTSDRAFLLVNISPMGADFPADISAKAFYDQAQTRKQQGQVTDARWLLLDGVKGVMFREAAPEDSSGVQRLQWMGYRKYKGQTQLVNIMLSSEGKYFTQNEDAMYGILYSTKMTK